MVQSDWLRKGERADEEAHILLLELQGRRKTGDAAAEAAPEVET
jgi:hypothetical protein